MCVVQKAGMGSGPFREPGASSQRNRSPKSQSLERSRSQLPTTLSQLSQKQGAGSQELKNRERSRLLWLPHRYFLALFLLSCFFPEIWELRTGSQNGSERAESGDGAKERELGAEPRARNRKNGCGAAPTAHISSGSGKKSLI